MSRKIDTGYEGAVPDDFSFPPSGIEDIDRSLFNLFDKVIPLQVTIDDQSTKVPVVFSTGERFALTRRKRPIRDNNNALILPVMSIHRMGIDHTPGQGGYGTAISFRDQQSYTVRKRLDPKDRNYQKIINKLRLKNQDDVSSRSSFGDTRIFPGYGNVPGKVASRRNLNNLSYLDDPTGALMRDSIENNIFEIITIPYPTFMAIDYEVTLWTQYMTQMNQLIESIFSKFSGQGHEFLLKSDSGYEYIAFMKSPLSNADNFQDFSQDERIIKYTFNITVPGYLIAPQHPGLPTPFRKFYSAPQIEFGYHQVGTQVIKEDPLDAEEKDPNKFILSDVKDLNRKGEADALRGQGSERLLEVVKDPFSGEESSRYVKVLTRNQRSGETVASSRIVVDLETTLDTPSD
jgi:hypothetical protein